MCSEGSQLSQLFDRPSLVCEIWEMDGCIGFLPTESLELYLHTLRMKFHASHVSNKSMSLLAFDFSED